MTQLQGLSGFGQAVRFLHSKLDGMECGQYRVVVAQATCLRWHTHVCGEGQMRMHGLVLAVLR
jgi:hypothetical protein